jgi:hypothetical protein
MKSRKEEIKMEDSVREQVESYVYAKYKSFANKPLIIKEYDAMFTIATNKDASPLILGKGILG